MQPASRNSFSRFADQLRLNLLPRVEPELRPERQALLRRMLFAMLAFIGVWAVALLVSGAAGAELPFADYWARIGILAIVAGIGLWWAQRGGINGPAYLLSGAIFLHAVAGAMLTPEHILRVSLTYIVPVLISGAIISAWAPYLFAGLGLAASVATASLLLPSFQSGFWAVTYLVVHAMVLFATAAITGSLAEQIRKMGGSYHRQADQMSRLAHTDPLTNLPNRRHLFDRLESEFARAQRYRRPFCLLYIDLDGFKAINDRFGHLFGDEILRGSAIAMQSVLRSTDLLARVGGDEFAVVLPETDLTGAKSVGSKLRKAMAAYGHQLSPSLETLTLSIGVGEISEEDDAIEDILARADEDQYRDKSSNYSQS